MVLEGKFTDSFIVAHSSKGLTSAALIFRAIRYYSVTSFDASVVLIPA
jgi:hypothetical protein